MYFILPNILTSCAFNSWQKQFFFLYKIPKSILYLYYILSITNSAVGTAGMAPLSKEKLVQ
jgi:hypothetical protein